MVLQRCSCLLHYSVFWRVPMACVLGAVARQDCHHSLAPAESAGSQQHQDKQHPEQTWYVTGIADFVPIFNIAASSSSCGKLQANPLIGIKVAHMVH